MVDTLSGRTLSILLASTVVESSVVVVSVLPVSCSVPAMTPRPVEVLAVVSVLYWSAPRSAVVVVSPVKDSRQEDDLVSEPAIWLMTAESSEVKVLLHTERLQDAARAKLDCDCGAHDGGIENMSILPQYLLKAAVRLTRESAGKLLPRVAATSWCKAVAGTPATGRCLMI